MGFSWEYSTTLFKKETISRFYHYFKNLISRLVENPGRAIRYLITINGPEPVSARTSRIDYQHYLDRQLAPVADGILHFLDDNFARLTATQLELFAP